MADFIQAKNITGLKVYGQQQVDYTVNGEAGCDFGAAVARASMQRAVSVESATSALADVVRARERKLTEIGEALAYVAAAAANFTSKSKTDDSTSSAGLATAKDILSRYNIDTSHIGVTEFPGIGRIGSIQNQYVSKLQTDTQYALDKEDNYLQQDMVSLQSYFSKRDQALSMAASLVKKVNNTMSSGIRAIR
jgi:hypothetical protein